MWKNEELDILREKYPLLGAIGCSDFIEKSIKQIRNKASKLKIKITPEIKNLIQKKNASNPKKVCNVCADKFIDPNKETAYLLGFLWADGYLVNTKKNPYRISLEINKLDFDQIEPILDLTGKWVKTTRTRPNRKLKKSAITNNKRFYEFLKQLNYTGDSPLLNKIEPILMPHWMRGFFDGDGCFYYHKKRHLRQMTFSGPYKQDWSFLTEILKSISVKFKIVLRTNKKGHKSSCVLTSDKESIKNFGEYIYRDSEGIRLSRKYNKLSMML